MNGRVVLLLVALIACKDNSGTAHKVSPAPEHTPASTAPEPPGGPPSCAEVGAHLAAALAMPEQAHTNVKGVDVAVSGTAVKDGIDRGIAGVCREDAWSLDARKCALTWQGNILRDRAGLRDACPGTLK